MQEFAEAHTCETFEVCADCPACRAARPDLFNGFYPGQRVVFAQSLDWGDNWQWGTVTSVDIHHPCISGGMATALHVVYDDGVTSVEGIDTANPVSAVWPSPLSKN